MGGPRAERRPLGSVLLAGFVATTVMTLAMFLPRVGGWPETDIALLLGQAFPGGERALYNANWWLGCAWHFVNGVVVFPLLYAFAADRFLPGPRWLRGLQFSLVLWLLIETVAMPLLGAGIFADQVPEPMRFTLVYLLGHVVYGLFLGGLAGARPAGEALVQRRIRAARVPGAPIAFGTAPGDLAWPGRG